MATKRKLQKLYCIVGVPEAGSFTLGSFRYHNRDMDPREHRAIAALGKGKRVTLGGGAGGTYTIRRLR